MTTALMVCLIMLDAVITQLAVDAGLASEGNALMVDFVNNGSFVWLKLAGCLFASTALYLVYKRFPYLATGTAGATSLLYVAVLIWNMAVIT